MVHKTTNTEPLIVISRDEIIDLGNKLSLLTFDSSLKIFVDTLNNDYVFCKPKLARGPFSVPQIGLLAAQPATHKGSHSPRSAWKTTSATGHATYPLRMQLHFKRDYPKHYYTCIYLFIWGFTSLSTLYRSYHDR